MKYLKNIGAGFALTALILSTPSHANEGGASKDSNQPNKEEMAKKSRQVSGHIIMKKTVQLPQENQKNVVVMIRTNKNDERLIVDLGSAESFKEQKLEVGTEITVEGRLVQLGQYETLVARNLKIDGKTMKADRKAQSEHAKEAQKKSS